MVTRNGFSLVEVIVAMLLLSVGMLAVSGGGLLAARLLREAEAEEAMSLAAATLLDSLMIQNVHGGSTIITPRYRLDWSADSSGATVRSVGITGASLTLKAAR